MRNVLLQIKENEQVTGDVYRMVLTGNVGDITAPGQFVNIRLEGLYLRRPISVNDLDTAAGELTLLYKVVGEGTARLSRLKPGKELDVLIGLGNGFDLTQAGESPILVGGGIGCAPLYYLAKCLRQDPSRQVTVIMGFKNAGEIYYREAFERLGCQVKITTEDGSFGTRGFVTAEIPAEGPGYLYVCGPEPMLKAVYRSTSLPGEFSFEERMGCGFGACMGCSCKTVTGYKRICKDGPVLGREEILW